jgi:hypothetical protein
LGKRRRKNILGLFVLLPVIAVPIALGVFYLRGELDHTLATAGLNWEPCSDRYDGTMRCGDELPVGTRIDNGVHDWVRGLY